MTASPDCTPFSWMMPSTVRSAFVFSWIKVSVPLVKCLSPYWTTSYRNGASSWSLPHIPRSGLLVLEPEPYLWIGFIRRCNTPLENSHAVLACHHL